MTTRLEAEPGASRSPTPAAAAPRSPQRKIAPIALGVMAGVLLLALGMRAAIPDADAAAAIPTVPVKRGDVKITVTESGELRAEHQATIQATNDKMIVWMAPEGSWVKQGDVIVKLDSSKYEIQRGAANSSVEAARAQLESALSALEAHKSAERKAYLEYEKLPELAEKGFINKTEVETARLAYEEVRSSGRSYQASVQAARAHVDRAEQEVNQAQRKYELGTMTAPRDGLVVYAHVGDPGSNRKVQVGMTPFEGMDLMYLPDLSSMIVETEISEVDLARVKVGSPAELRMDAYPDDVFRGEVTLVSGLARRKVSRVTGKPTGLKVFDVTIKVLEQDKRLKPGLTVTADILVNAYEDALYVPVAAVFLDELDRTTVYIEGPDGIDPREVTIADSSDRVAVVTEGLAEGEQILLGAPHEV